MGVWGEKLDFGGEESSFEAVNRGSGEINGGLGRGTGFRGGKKRGF